MKYTAQAPTRLSIACGGTDVPPFCNKYGGRALNIAINIRNHAELDIIKGDQSFLSCLGTSYMFDVKKPELDCPREVKLAMGVVDFFRPKQNFNLETSFDHIPNTGLGGSGSAGVMLVALFNKWLNYGLKVDKIYKLAWDIENTLLGRTGIQDQVAGLFGGLNYIKIDKLHETKKDITVYREVSPDIIHEFRECLLLFYLGEQRESSKIQEQMIDQENKFNKMNTIAESAYGALLARDYDQMGNYLNDMWELKQAVSPASTSKLANEAYYKAMTAGAWGGKVTGAGKGHMVFMASPDKHEKIRKRLYKLDEVDFNFDYNGCEVRRVNE